MGRGGAAGAAPSLPSPARQRRRRQEEEGAERRHGGQHVPSGRYVGTRQRPPGAGGPCARQRWTGPGRGAPLSRGRCAPRRGEERRTRPPSLAAASAMAPSAAARPGRAAGRRQPVPAEGPPASPRGGGGGRRFLPRQPRAPGGRPAPAAEEEKGSAALRGEGGSGAAGFLPLLPRRGPGTASLRASPRLASSPSRRAAKGPPGGPPAPPPAEPAHRSRLPRLRGERGAAYGGRAPPARGPASAQPCRRCGLAGPGGVARAAGARPGGRPAALPSVPYSGLRSFPLAAEFLRAFLRLPRRNNKSGRVTGGFLSAFLLPDVTPEECAHTRLLGAGQSVGGGGTWAVENTGSVSLPTPGLSK